MQMDINIYKLGSFPTVYDMLIIGSVIVCKCGKAVYTKVKNIQHMSPSAAEPINLYLYTFHILFFASDIISHVSIAWRLWINFFITQNRPFNCVLYNIKNMGQFQ